MYRKILQDELRFPEEIHEEARSLLTGLLTRDPNKRLGANGAEEIKRHPFFANHIDWKLLMAKKIQPREWNRDVLKKRSFRLVYLTHNSWLDMQLLNPTS